jgi:hypothetical protein
MGDERPHSMATIFIPALTDVTSLVFIMMVMDRGRALESTHSLGPEMFRD